MPVGHFVQAWKLTDLNSGRKTIRVQMQHAVKGKRGAFQLVAWTDSNHDGLPDTEIARSQIVTPDSKHLWSELTFQTESNDVFVGNRWKRHDSILFYGMNYLPKGWEGLSHEVYFSRTAGEMPTQLVGPRCTNLRVSISY
jgi:hypothetical protein